MTSRLVWHTSYSPTWLTACLHYVTAAHPLGQCARLLLAHTRDGSSYRFVNRQSADRDRHLRVAWLNVRSLADKSAVLHETIVAHRASRGIFATAEILVSLSDTGAYDNLILTIDNNDRIFKLTSVLNNNTQKRLNNKASNCNSLFINSPPTEQTNQRRTFGQDQHYEDISVLNVLWWCRWINAGRTSCMYTIPCMNVVLKVTRCGQCRCGALKMQNRKMTDRHLTDNNIE